MASRLAAGRGFPSCRFGARLVSVAPVREVVVEASAKMAKVAKKPARKTQEPVTRDYTVHLHKYLHKTQFKKRAPRAIRAIRRFAEKVRV